MEDIRNKDVLIIWPICLIGFPTLALVLLFCFGFIESIFDNKLGYVFSVGGSLILVLFGLFNVFFSFYTLSTFWNVLKLKEKAVYILVALLANALGSYILAKLWKSKGISIYSLEGKKKHNEVSFVFYFLFSVSLLIPMFIASRQF